MYNTGRDEGRGCISKSQESTAPVRVLRGLLRHSVDVSQEGANIWTSSPGVMMFNSNSSKQVKTSFSMPSLPMTLEDAGMIFGVGVKDKEK